MPLQEPETSLFEGVPGPSPWYLGLPDAPTVPGFRWKKAGESQPCWGKTLLVGPDGPVAVLGFYNWVARVSDTSLLVWRQPHVDSGTPTAPVGLAVIVPRELSPLEGDAESLCASMASNTAMLLGESPTVEFKLDTTIVGNRLHATFPEPLHGLKELLILCCSSGANPAPDWRRGDFALLVAQPAASSYQLFAQDWFNQGDFDYGYEWVTRVVRHPETGRVHGEGIRIQPFVLDDNLRNLGES